MCYVVKPITRTHDCLVAVIQNKIHAQEFFAAIQWLKSTAGLRTSRLV
jgi:hypothetical protein